jgi:hypothetical protein
MRCIGKIKTINGELTKIYGSFQDVDVTKKKSYLVESENNSHNHLEASQIALNY